MPARLCCLANSVRIFTSSELEDPVQIDARDLRSPVPAARRHDQRGVGEFLAAIESHHPATCINGVAVVTFVVASAVDWPAAIIMIVGGIVGGYGGAAAARRVDQAVVRRIVIVVGLGMAIYFFTTQYLTV